jgi:putative NADH-flavin reductase
MDSVSGMSKIVIFGAGGTLGRLAVKEAVGRGHDVTAAVRDPSRHPDLAGAVPAHTGASVAPSVSAHLAAGGRSADLAAGRSPAVRVVAADATDPDAVAAAAAGHDVAIASLYQPGVPPDVFYARAAHALLTGLARAELGRLLFVGMAANLEIEPGVRIMDTPGFPLAHVPFALGHTVALHLLRAADTPVDWLMLTPPLAFAADGERTGAYRTGGDAVLGERLSYADFAVALLDEVEAPAHHRTRIAVAA